MKKILLSVLAMGCVAGLANAATVTLNVNDATDIEGTLVEETVGDDGKVQAAKHYEALTSLKLGDYQMSFSKGENEKTAPAYYYPTSTSSSTQNTIRVYVSNTLTFTAPEGKEFKSLVFTGTNGKDGDKVVASVGSVTATAKVQTWTNSEKVSTVTLTYPGSFRIETIEVSDEAGTVVEPTESTFNKVTTLENGLYVFAIGSQIGAPVNPTYSYGRMTLVDATFEGDAVKTSDENAYEITVADGKATIKANGKFYSMDDSHFTNFQLYVDAMEGSYWTYSFDGDKVKFVNELNKDCFVCQSKGTESWYSNIAPAKAPAEFNLPVLYKKAGSGVKGVSVNENAEVVYYNLQGVKVANPEKGVYIRVADGKSVKVMK